MHTESDFRMAAAANGIATASSSLRDHNAQEMSMFKKHSQSDALSLNTEEDHRGLTYSLAAVSRPREKKIMHCTVLYARGLTQQVA